MRKSNMVLKGTTTCRKANPTSITLFWAIIQSKTCHPMNNSRGKRSSIPPHKTRPDSPVPTLHGLWDPSQIRRIRSQERNPVVPASTSHEALFHCTKPSGVPRGPSQLHSDPDFSEARWEASWGHWHKLMEARVSCCNARKTSRVLL